MNSALPRLDPVRQALFLDIDGTLLDIAPTPDSVMVEPELRHDLAMLYRLFGGALALISGRSLPVIDQLFHIRLPAAGTHGAEWRLTPNYGEIAPPLPDGLRRRIAAAFAAQPELMLEDKLFSFAVHYRENPALDLFVRDTLAGLTASDDTLMLIDGKMVVEITHRAVNKGTALDRFMECPPFLGRQPVFLGDDMTDAFAIAAARARDGIGLQVGDAIPGLSPATVRRWLHEERLRLEKNGAGAEHAVSGA